ncbi:MAG TPA: SPFH domain-containing protein [Planctomycetota bacterium]|nr:SPFH domain-containing protein [Planctomycetota bacterium]
MTVTTTQAPAPQSSLRNDYLDQVVRQQKQVEYDLKARRAASKCAAPMLENAPAAGRARDLDDTRFFDSGATGAVGGNAVEVRMSGFWRWKSVVVPPNAYVVHTRRGHAEPLHLGLGVSFRYNPVTDSYLVVPSAMQTIIINANCICREKQGILVQGYVQWIIEDFKTAYRKLDFSDALDPMRVVNVQLREQAEAAIKDVVATMSIDGVLADKQPIIKELTTRLRHVAEGDGNDKGLGLRIVQVQIKEAVVSSPRVWEMLQRPFRAERAKEARLAELTHEALVQTREAEAEKARSAQDIATQAEVARLTAEAAAATFDREQAERVRRAKAEAETLAQTTAHEKEKLEKEAALARTRLEQTLIEEGMRQEAQNRQVEKEIGFEAARRRIDNDLSATALQKQLIEFLPSIAEKLPHPKEVRSFQIGGADSLGALVGGLLKLLEAARGGKAD